MLLTRLPLPLPLPLQNNQNINKPKQDYAVKVGLLLALSFTAFLLIMRLFFWDSRKKLAWPVLDMTSLCLYAILFGLAFPFAGVISQWLMVIVPATYAISILISILWRR